MNGVNIREGLRNYFTGIGAVPWQFCSRSRKEKDYTYTPFDPQPEKEDILTIDRYCSIKNRLSERK